MKPCLLIPIYNHKDEIHGVIESLAPHGLPCLVIDDGSNPDTHKVLDEIENDFPWVHVYHRTRNGGKGAALKMGYKLAAQQGFSHVIQIDADGQHDASDVPRLLACMREQPDALVLAQPIFDESVPRRRLYARQLSRGFVWLATLSFDVRDPLVGFRGFPLEAVLRMMAETETGDHMDFDPEMVVRLYWQGLPIVNFRTKVIYHAGGLSHFDLLRDYPRLAWLYARLVFGMGMRSPELLARRLRR